ncbi:MAG: twin transmembrane helix small protein [Henriciella sp.]|jgi:putative copper export protein
MATLLSYGLFIGIAALVVVLILGLVNLLKTDEGQPSRSNKLMRARIIAQFAVILVLILLAIVMGAFPGFRG